MSIERITVFCFAASYAVAFALELLLLFRSRALARLLATIFGSAGLLAHTLFLVAQRVSLMTQAGSLLFLAWILAMFYLYGSIHHRRVAWGVFVLPLVLGLTILGGIQNQALGTAAGSPARLLSLERLEQMNRRGIDWAFPLLTIGLLVGMVQLAQAGVRLQGWTDPRILSTLILWFVFTLLLYLRYGFHLRGRSAALLTIMAFALLLITLVTGHSFQPGGGP